MSLVKLLTMEPGDESIGYTCKIGTLVLGLYATQTSDLSIKGLIVDKNCSVRPDNYQLNIYIFSILYTYIHYSHIYKLNDNGRKSRKTCMQTLQCTSVDRADVFVM